MGSPRPDWISPPAKNTTCPPNSRIPTSKETLVRVEALAKIMAQVWPASGWVRGAPRCFFSPIASLRILSISALVSFSMLSKCFMVSSSGEFCRNGLEHRYSFFGLTLSQIQGREQTQDLDTCWNRQDSGCMQELSEANGLGTRRIARKFGDVWC